MYIYLTIKDGFETCLALKSAIQKCENKGLEVETAQDAQIELGLIDSELCNHIL